MDSRVRRVQIGGLGRGPNGGVKGISTPMDGVLWEAVGAYRALRGMGGVPWGGPGWSGRVQDGVRKGSEWG